MEQTMERSGSSLLSPALFTGGASLVSDRDNDGFPEHIDITLGTVPGMNSGPVWAGLINLGACLGMASCGPETVPPPTCTAPEPNMLLVKKPSARTGWAAGLEKTATGGWLLSGSNPRAMKRMLDTLAVSPLGAGDADIVRIELARETGTVCRVAHEDGRESLAELSSFSPPPPAGLMDTGTVADLTSLADLLLPAAEQEPRDSCLALSLELPEILSPQCGRALFSLVSAAVCRATRLTLPLAHVDGRGSGGICLAIIENDTPEARIRLDSGKLSATGRGRELSGLIRELARLWFEADAPGGEPLESWKNKLFHRVLAAGDRGAPVKAPAGQTIRRRMTLKGEAQRLVALTAKIPEGSGGMRCRAFSGGNFRARQSLGETLERCLADKGYNPGVIVLRTHKPAVSWLLEEVEPALPEGAQSLCISVRPFSRPGCLESRARWIHEMYPAPDVICQRRGWQVDQVEMAMDASQAHAYFAVAFDDGGRRIAEFKLSPMVSELPYKLDRQEGRSAYPCAAGFEITWDDGTVRNYPIPTDRELFWQRFQESWLPGMENAMKEMLPQLEATGALAFWEEIRIEVTMDDAQETLRFAEERIAPMEALHEDLYFGLLEFMQAFRHTYCPESRIQLGRVVPLMRPARGGRPWARLRLKPMQMSMKVPPDRPVIDNLGYARGRLFVDLPGDRGERFSARPARPAQHPGPAAAVTAPDFQAIPPGDAVREWTRSLAGRPGIRVWTAGRTLMGRDIVAVEATAGGMSAQRARLLKPTLLVNARHHANEVSGTNAAMGLLHTLACTKKGAALLHRVNIVVVPLENGDGVATLEEMLPDCPDHKLHAARYNALGLEWYDQYFDSRSPFTEARVKARLFNRWLPAWLMDLHGVPSHEWEQPFAGYINPRFREHWIPRSFVYAILPFYGRDSHPAAEEATELATAMSAALEAEQDIVEQNRRIFDRYRRYAKAFEPEVFDSDMQGALVVVPTCERISETNFGNQKWPLVRSEIITEVLDEVARGPWLERCTRAHLKVIGTVLDHMGQDHEKPVLTRRETGLGVTFSWERQSKGDQDEISPSR